MLYPPAFCRAAIQPANLTVIYCLIAIADVTARPWIYAIHDKYQGILLFTISLTTTR